MHALPHSVPLTLQQALPKHTSVIDSWTFTGKSGSVSSGVIAPFSWVLVCTRFCLCLQESVSPVLCKFWWLYGGVSGNLLQEGLCHTQIYCTQSPCPCGRPLLTHTFAGDIQTQFCLSLWVLVHTGMFEPSKHLWQVWCLILNRISPLLPSFWGFSFALGREVSRQSHSSTTQPPLQHSPTGVRWLQHITVSQNHATQLIRQESHD